MFMLKGIWLSAAEERVSAGTGGEVSMPNAEEFSRTEASG